MKPSIRKRDGEWTLTRPAFGFGHPQVTAHPSWQAARDALLGTAVSSAGPIVERGYYTLPQINYFYQPQRGTIRMEDT